jgi:hypothetical protein
MGVWSAVHHRAQDSERMKAEGARMVGRGSTEPCASRRVTRGESTHVRLRRESPYRRSPPDQRFPLSSQHSAGSEGRPGFGTVASHLRASLNFGEVLESKRDLKMVLILAWHTTCEVRSALKPGWMHPSKLNLKNSAARKVWPCRTTHLPMITRLLVLESSTLAPSTARRTFRPIPWSVGIKRVLGHILPPVPSDPSLVAGSHQSSLRLPLFSRPT